MSGKFYMLVNPYVEGKIPKIYKADNSLKAAKMSYDALSKYFNNVVHNFKFSLLKLKSEDVDADGKVKTINLKQYGGSPKNKKFDTHNFSHFVVNEDIDKQDNVDFSIKKYTGKVENVEDFVGKIFKLQNKLKKSKKSKTVTNEVSDSAESATASESAQDGGAKSKYDDDDEEDSPDMYVKHSYVYDPISYYYYYPSMYSLDTLYLPTFISPLSFPYVIDYPRISYNTNPSVSVTY
jgi:hypothetical protein